MASTTCEPAKIFPKGGTCFVNPLTLSIERRSRGRACKHDSIISTGQQNSNYHDKKHKTKKKTQQPHLHSIPAVLENFMHSLRVPNANNYFTPKANLRQNSGIIKLKTFSHSYQLSDSLLPNSPASPCHNHQLASLVHKRRQLLVAVPYLTWTPVNINYLCPELEIKPPAP